MDLDELTNRVSRQALQDGLPDLICGAMMLSYSLWFSLSTLLTKGSTAGQIYSFAQSVVFAATNLSLAWAYRKLKARLTFPRTGYAATIKPSPKRLWLFLSIAILGPIGQFIVRDHPQVDWSAAGIAAYTIAMAVALGIPGIRMNLPHMQVLALFTLILGIALTGRFPFIQSFIWFNLFLGAAMFLGGAIRLHTFLKTHPR